MMKHLPDTKPSSGKTRHFVLRRTPLGVHILDYYTSAEGIFKEQPKGSIEMPHVAAIRVVNPQHHIALGSPVRHPKLGMGVLRFWGPHPLTKNEMAGIELESAAGDTDGVLAGQRLFRCQKNHGVFVHGNEIAAVRMDLQPFSASKSKEAGKYFTLELVLKCRTDHHRRTQLWLTAPTYAEMTSWLFAISRAALDRDPVEKGTANWRELATLSKKNTVTLADAGIPQITIDTFEDHMAYHEDLIRQSAEDILFAQAKPGLFLLRPSRTKQGITSLSVVVMPDRIEHHDLWRNDEGFVFDDLLLPAECSNASQVLKFLAQPQLHYHWIVPLTSFIDKGTGTVFAFHS